MGAWDDNMTKKIPHYEHLTMVDHIRAGFQPNIGRDPNTGATTDPQREFLTSQAAKRKAEYDQEQAQKQTAAKSGG